MSEPGYQWKAEQWTYEDLGDVIHVLPIDDLKEHDIGLGRIDDGAEFPYTSNCWCGASVDEDGLVIHDAMDRRQEYERNERKPS